MFEVIVILVLIVGFGEIASAINKNNKDSNGRQAELEAAIKKSKEE